jgi:hypothetical protein
MGESLIYETYVYDTDTVILTVSAFAYQKKGAFFKKWHQISLNGEERGGFLW